MKNLPENQGLIIQIENPLLAITNQHAEENQKHARVNLTFSEKKISVGKIGCACKNIGAKHNIFTRYRYLFTPSRQDARRDAIS